jgi:uncharacterized protein (DUF58 family)
MPQYLNPTVVAKAEALGLKARVLVEGLRVGDHKSPYRGFSVEFVQHREYVPGDDIRHIDWKSYGRSERYTIKQYEQETNFIAHVLVDASKSMRYGQGETNKLEVAKTLAACLSYVIAKQRDTVSLSVFDSTYRVQLPASSQLGHINAILAELENTRPEEKTNIATILRLLADKVRRRGLVFLISDCFDQPSSILTGLQQLRFLGHDVTVFHVMHGDELTFPFDGNVRFDGLEEVEEIRTRPRLIRQAYLNEVQAFLTELRKGCETYRCDYVCVDTTKPLAVILSEYLARRLQGGR